MLDNNNTMEEKENIVRSSKSNRRKIVKIIEK